MTRSGLDVGKIITAQELGRYLKLSEATIYKLAFRGELPGFKIGDSWRFDMEEILELVQGAKMQTKKRGDTRGENKTTLASKEAFFPCVPEKELR